MAYRPQVKTSNGMVDLPIEAERTKIDLIWQTASPHSNFGEQTLNDLPNFSQYEYLILVWQPAPNGNAKQYIKFQYYNDSGSSNYSVPFSFVDDTGEVWHRKLQVQSNNTSIYFSGAYSGNGTTPNSARCVPIAIYGTNSV